MATSLKLAILFTHSLPVCPFYRYPRKHFSKTEDLPPEWTLRVGLWRTNSVCSCNQPCALRAPTCGQDWEGQCSKRCKSTALCNQEKPVLLARSHWDASVWRVCMCVMPLMFKRPWWKSKITGVKWKPQNMSRNEEVSKHKIMSDT